VIPDGTYDAFVIDAERGLADDGTEHMHLDLTILSGEQKGNVVSLTAAVGTFSLDYADASAFTRAFRRWTDSPPAAWRAKVRSA